MSKARRSTITPEQMSFISGVSTLQRAVWRITYKDPYNALMYYFHFSSLSDYLMRLMRLRERCEKYMLRKAIQKWVNNAIGLRSDADSKLLKLFNLYEKNKNNKNIILSRALHRWKNQGLALENYLLKLKILKLSISKTAALKEKSKLQRAFDNWKNNAKELYRQLLYGKDVDDLKQQQHKNLGARLLLGYFGKVKQISSMRHNNRALQRWKDQIRNLKAKERIEYQQDILKAKQHMLKHNINKNGEDLINRFRNKYLENIIKKYYSKLLEKTVPNYLNRVLHHYFGVWRNTANALRERDIYRVLQLKNIITYENLRNSENDRYNAMKTLLKWSKNAKPDNSLDKIKNIREGLESVTKTMKLKYGPDLLKGIADRAKQKKERSLLYEIISKLDKNFDKLILKKTLEDWNNRVKDSAELKNRLVMLFNNYINTDNIRNKLFEPYKDLINGLKTYNDQKVNAGKTIVDFCKNLTDIKNQMKTMDRLLMLNEIVIKNSVRSRRLLKSKFHDWIRNARLIKAEEDAIIIQDFIRTKLKGLKILEQNITDASKILENYFRNVFMKRLTAIANRKGKFKLLLNLIKNRMDQEKKIKRKIIKKWIDYINSYCKPNDAATTIQKFYRGMKGRKLRDLLFNKNNKLKKIFERNNQKNNDILKSKLAKWADVTKKLNLDENAKIIQDFCKRNLEFLKTITVKNTRNKIYEN